MGITGGQTPSVIGYWVTYKALPKVKKFAQNQAMGGALSIGNHVVFERSLLAPLSTT